MASETVKKSRYDDIINLPHHTSVVHPRMSDMNRAAQFSSFEALNGFGDEIDETGRFTDSKADIDENSKDILDEKLRIIISRLELHPEVSITYFIDDAKKSGGAYHTVNGCIKKIDSYNKTIVFTDGLSISIDSIKDINFNDIF
ncbi:MAG: hypothetical protein IJM37_02885 [Lachnospiraceae bacterium]|nr:hypothetical protein [Lachnospiraceae bacterium]